MYIEEDAIAEYYQGSKMAAVTPQLTFIVQSPLKIEKKKKTSGSDHFNIPMVI